MQQCAAASIALQEQAARYQSEPIGKRPFDGRKVFRTAHVHLQKRSFASGAADSHATPDAQRTPMRSLPRCCSGSRSQPCPAKRSSFRCRSAEIARGGLKSAHARHHRLVRPLQAPHPRPHARARGADLRAPVRRLRRRRDQDREHRRSRTWAGRATGPDFQNLHRNKRSITLDLKSAEGQGDLHAPGEDRRRGGGELPPRREGPPRHRLRVAEEGQQAHHPRQHLRLRPGRPLPRAPRLRPDRAGPVRHHVGDRQARRRPDARRLRGGRRRRRACSRRSAS